MAASAKYPAAGPPAALITASGSKRAVISGRESNTRRLQESLGAVLSNSPLGIQIRMVAGFADVIAREETFGCRGLQPSELFSAAF
jgi:hypothetical protein